VSLGNLSQWISNQQASNPTLRLSSSSELLRIKVTRQVRPSAHYIEIAFAGIVPAMDSCTEVSPAQPVNNHRK